METLWQDLRYGLRRLGNRPGFTLVAVLTLSLGLGANTAIFSVVRAVLLRPLPYNEPDRLVILWGNLVNRNLKKFPISPIDLQDYRQQTKQFEGFAGVSTFQQTLTGGDAEPQQIVIGSVTPNFNDLMGVRPMLGRDFEADDAAPIGDNVNPNAAPPTSVLLGYGLWQRRFGGDPNAAGRRLEIGGNPALVVGVMPQAAKLFLGPGAGMPTEVDAWTAPRINVATWPSRRNVMWRVIGRLKPGVAIGQAQAEMDALAARLREQESVYETAGYRIDVVPMLENLTAEVRPMVLALLGAVGFVLLIACANVASLVLVRASERDREIAVRSALGGSRRRLVQQFLTESGVLALAGGALGLLLAFGGVKLLLALRPANLPRIDTVGVDGMVLAFTFVISLGAALFFGAIPAIQASKPQLVESLKDRGRSPPAPGQRVFRNSLVIVEIALSVVLLIGAGLMIRSFIALQRVEPGYDPENVLTFEISLPGARYSQAARLDFTRLFRERLESLPGVISASAAFPLPLEERLFSGRYGTEEALTDETAYGQADYRVVLPGYFETMRTRLREGRVFTQADFTGAAEVTIIDETLARILWPGKPAVGKRMLIRARTTDPEWVEVIGVVEHQRARTLAAEGRETLYLTNSYMGALNTLGWIVRSAGDPAPLAAQARAELAALDPQLPVPRVTTMSARVHDAMTGTRFALVLIAVFSGVALALAAVGIYAMLSSVVRQRTGEIGVRMAFGAETGSILWLILRQGLALTIAGLAVGLLAAFWATRLLSTLLVDVRPTDPLTFVWISAFFLAVAMVSCYIPSRRATRVDPLEALRYE